MNNLETTQLNHNIMHSNTTLGQQVIPNNIKIKCVSKQDVSMQPHDFADASLADSFCSSHHKDA